MSFPKQSEIELPLLKTLQELGGKAEPKELYPKLAEVFPQLTEEDLTARLQSSPSTFRWHNLVQWSRQKLVEKGEIDGSTRGVWKLTARGRVLSMSFKFSGSAQQTLSHSHSNGSILAQRKWNILLFSHAYTIAGSIDIFGLVEKEKDTR
jgi:hypothetical protein